jgi:hypothetical protein
MSEVVQATEVSPGRFTATVSRDTRVVMLPPEWVGGAAEVAIGAADDEDMPRSIRIGFSRAMLGLYVVHPVVQGTRPVTASGPVRVIPERESVGGDVGIRTRE